MKHMRFMLLVTVAIQSGITRPSVSLEAYSVDPEIKRILDEHSREIFNNVKSIHETKQCHGVWQYEWLPGYYIKYGLARIKGVERMRRCIEKYQLDKLTTPDKRIYHIKGRPTDFSDLNYVVVVKAVESADKPWELTRDEAKQLCAIIHKTDYVSMTSTNYIKMPSGKICLIDTEGTFDPKIRIKGLVRMIGAGHDLNTAYTKEALQHVFLEIKMELEQHPAQQGFALPYLKKSLDSQKAPYAWDYFSYADGLGFPI